MQYKTILSHVELDSSSSNVWRVSGDLAQKMGATVIGVAGARLIRPYSEVPIEGLFEQERASALEGIDLAEQAFRNALEGKAKHLEWRSTCGFLPLADYIASQARAADLIVTGPDIGPRLIDATQRTNIGGLVLMAGRPVLIVPPEQDHLTLESVVIAWKDTREARRAAADALPLLKLAKQVTVLEVAAQQEMEGAHQRVRDVAVWLNQHGIKADPIAEPADHSDLAGIRRVMEKRKCDLLVAGAYGHSRLREWVFGGVTGDLLLPAEQCVLLSH